MIKEYSPLDLIDDLLKENNIKNVQLSNMTGISQVHISNMRNKKIKSLPNQATIKNIISAIKRVNKELNVAETYEEYQLLEKRFKEKEK